MSDRVTVDTPASTLCSVAHTFYQRGWMAGTAGNLSLRDPDVPDQIWITASGKSKGTLTPEDIMLIDLNSNRIIEKFSSSNRPSAETSIHQAIYRHFPDVQACYHIHSVYDLLATERYARTGELPLPNIEMIKGLGIWDDQPDVAIKVFPNHHSVPDIAQEMSDFFTHTAPVVTACMIQQHGITVWGSDPTETLNKTEAIEFIMKYLALNK